MSKWVAYVLGLGGIFSFVVSFAYPFGVCVVTLAFLLSFFLLLLAAEEYSRARKQEEV